MTVAGDADGLRRYRRALEGLVGVPATEGNEVDVLRNGVEIFPAMLDAIADATETIDLCTYVYWTGDIAVRFADALSERARAGVRVRVLLDAVGALRMDRGLSERMSDAGCRLEWFRPPTTWKLWETTHRTHRKVLICDEDVAFIGGVGIAREWEGDARDPSEWRDTHLRLRGPAVDGLRAAFVGNWAETGHALFDQRDRFPEQPQPGGACVQVVQSPAQYGWSGMSTALAALIGVARRCVKVTSAYFVPDERFRDLLCDTADRGVAVDVLMPGAHTDKRVVQVAGEADYSTLLAAGVRIWRYQPTVLHAKILTVDGLVTCVGSANFDSRSMGLNEEANLTVFDPATVGVLDGHFAEDLAVSTLIDERTWHRRGPVRRAAEAVTELFEGQL